MMKTNPTNPTNDLLINDQISTQAAVEGMDRFNIASNGLPFRSNDGPWVYHPDAARLIAERDARIAELGARLDATQSMFMSAIRDLAAINVRLGCDPDEGGAAPIIEAIDELKRMIADQASKGHRLALELECLLLGIKDNAIVSKWWDSAWDAIEDWRKV